MSLLLGLTRHISVTDSAVASDVKTLRNISTIDTGNQTFWHWGSPIRPMVGVESYGPQAGTQSFWQYGSPIAPNLAQPNYGATWPGHDTGVYGDMGANYGVLNPPDVVDSGVGTDVSTVTRPPTVVSVTDSGTGTDVSTLHVALPRTDSGAGTEASFSYRRATDTGVGSDASHSIRNTTDSGIGYDGDTNHVINNFDTGQTTGTVITAANSVSAGNDGVSATSGSPKYSNVQAHSGTLSMLAQNSTNGEVRYTGLAPTEIWTRSYFYFQGVAPIGNTQIISVFDETGTGLARVSFLTTGVLQAIGISTSNFSTAMQTGQWYRIETHSLISGGTLTQDVLLFLGDSNIVLEQKTASGATAHTSFSAVDIGVAGSGFQTNQPFVDDIGYSFSGYLGPSTRPLSTLTVRLPQTDSAVGSDVSTQHVVLARTDSGVGSDASTEHATYPQTDSATGTDASFSTHRGTDSGTGSDNSTQHVALPRTDSGAGSDVSTEHVALSRTDSATGADVSTEHVALPRTDAATGTDASFSTRRGTDTGTGSDNSTIHISLPRTDTGTGSDVSTLHATLARTDSGAGTDASTLHATLARTDSGAGTDVSTLHVTLARTDSGTATDFSHETVDTTDTGTGSDASTLHVALPRTDSATGTDASHSIRNVTDAGAGAEDPQSPNLFPIKNEADLETSAATGDGITTQGSATITRDATHVQQGSFAAKVVTGGVATTEGIRLGTSTVGQMAARNAPVVAGHAYVGSAYVWGNAGGELLTIRIGWFDASGASISTVSGNFTGTTSFQRATISGVAPTGAAYASLSVLTRTTIQAATFWVDAAQLELGLLPTTWTEPGSRLYVAESGTTDTGTGSDASTLHASYTGTDAGAGTDASTLHASIARTDSASGSDTSTEHATFARSDTGAGTDASTEHASFSQSDTASAADSSASYRAGTDSATGADASTEAVALARSESGTGTDTATLHVPKSATDTGTGSEESTLHAALSPADTGSGSERITDRSLVLVDTAVGTEVSTLTTDSGDRSFHLSDSGTGTDASTLAAHYSKTDTSSGNDASTEHASYIRTDSATGNEVSSKAVSFNQTDSASGADSSFEAAHFGILDTGSGSDSSTPAAGFILLDSGHGLEFITDRSLYVVDTGHGADHARVNTHTGGTIPLVVWQRGKIHVWLSGDSKVNALYYPPLDPLEFTEPALYP